MYQDKRKIEKKDYCILNKTYYMALKKKKLLIIGQHF